MDNETYEQINLESRIVSELQEKFLIESSIVKIESYQDKPISIKLPDTFNLKVIEADTVVKGQTASSSFKNATTTNDIKILVPPHIKEGDKIIINTDNYEYLEKAKK